MELWGEDALLQWPGARRPLIQERDAYMARTIWAAASGKLLPGLRDLLRGPAQRLLGDLEQPRNTCMDVCVTNQESVLAKFPLHV